MADPNLVSSNCDGETSTLQIGFDPASVTPSKRLGLVKHDHRTIVNDDGLAAPGNGGDLPGGLKVNLCSEDFEQPYIARVTGTPNASISGTPDPQGTNIANALRMQLTDGGVCGLAVSPPKFTAISGGDTRVGIVDNPATGANDPTLNGPLIHSITIKNNDTVPRLFRVKGRFSFITQIDQGGNDTVVELIYATRINADDGSGLSYLNPELGTVRFVGAGTVNTRVVTITHPKNAAYSGYSINDSRDFIDEVILPPGTLRRLHYYTRTIRSVNVIPSANNVEPFRGVNIIGVSVEEVYAVGGA